MGEAGCLSPKVDPDAFNLEIPPMMEIGTLRPAWQSKAGAKPPPGASRMELYRSSDFLAFDADTCRVLVPVPLCWAPMIGHMDIARIAVPLERDPAEDNAALNDFARLGRIYSIVSSLAREIPSDRRLDADDACCICADSFCRPVEYGCGHVVCMSCALSHSAEPKVLRCPMCRQTPKFTRQLESEHVDRWTRDPEGYNARLAASAEALPKCLPNVFARLYATPFWLVRRRLEGLELDERFMTPEKRRAVEVAYRARNAPPVREERRGDGGRAWSKRMASLANAGAEDAAEARRALEHFFSDGGIRMRIGKIIRSFKPLEIAAAFSVDDDLLVRSDPEAGDFWMHHPAWSICLRCHDKHGEGETGFVLRTGGYFPTIESVCYVKRVKGPLHGLCDHTLYNHEYNFPRPPSTSTSNKRMRTK